MNCFRNWLIGIVLDALRARDELIDAELAALRGHGGEDARARYEQLQHGRLW